MPDALVLVQDILTIACGGFNAAYFATRWAGRDARPSHRVAAAALTLLNAAIALQSVFFLALYWTYRWQGALDRFFWPPAWLAARALLLAGTAFISALIFRQSISVDR
jgi:hypothetical protein